MSSAGHRSRRLALQQLAAWGLLAARTTRASPSTPSAQAGQATARRDTRAQAAHDAHDAHDARFNPVGAGKTSYDYIVVGSGAGGGPLAARLALAGYEVLVLEAGGLEGDKDTYEIPAFSLAASAEPAMNWNFNVKHYSDTSVQGRGDNWVEGEGGILYPRASTVGGCTAHHVTLSMQAENQDWDDLARLCNDPSWGSFNMRRAFAAVREWLPLEMTPPSLLLKDPVVTRLLAAAALETGSLNRLATVRPDFNHASLVGADLLDPNDPAHLDNLREGLFAAPQSTLRGARAGTRERLLQTMAQHPRQLFLQTHALASRVLLRAAAAGQSDGLRASGVEFVDRAHLYAADPLGSRVSAREQQSLTRQVLARREVILAGGAFNSPQLLMLSGIGERAQLARHGIATVLDLPGVGQNLQDRNELSVVTEFEQALDIAKSCTFGKSPDPCMAEYRSEALHRTYASNGVVAGIKRRYSKGSDHPEMFLFGSPVRFDGYRPGFHTRAVERLNYFTWAVLRGYNSQNTGYVRLRSARPTDSPEINFRYFADGAGGERDLDALVEGITLARQINARARALGWLDQNRDREVFPGPAVQSPEQLRALIRKGAWGHHASCSNKMGQGRDRLAVVDSRCKVFGTSNLRVVDASVFPRIPGLFIVLPVYMLSEKVSEDLLRTASHG